MRVGTHTHTEWNCAVVEDSDWLRRTLSRQEKAGPVKNMDTSLVYWVISPRRSRRLVSIAMETRVETRGGEGQQGATSCDLYTLPPVHSTTEFFPFAPESFFCLSLLSQLLCFHSGTMTVENLNLNLVRMSDTKGTTCLLVCLSVRNTG